MIHLTDAEAKRVFDIVWHEADLHGLDAYQWSVVWKLAKVSNQPESRMILIQQETERAIDALLLSIIK